MPRASTSPNGLAFQTEVADLVIETEHAVWTLMVVGNDDGSWLENDAGEAMRLHGSSTPAHGWRGLPLIGIDQSLSRRQRQRTPQLDPDDVRRGLKCLCAL
jgi:hypothetical protein